ncbi:HD domain-containing protein [Roseibium algae]|uniref:HD domain-containing protein n=1 Tax=Roseibium algae TaxID=3123038 RepID=A0ABU8TR99_9HYPH
MADLRVLCAVLPEDLSSEIFELWDEYTKGRSPEAILAKGFDKIETILQHVKGTNAPDFDFEFNLEYGWERTERHPLLKALRALSDNITKSQMTSQADKTMT